MTTLALWVGIDNRKISSVYIASDSRISWNEKQVWECGRKLFALQKSPDVFGYCGEVLFPSQVLSVIEKLSETGALWTQEATAEERHSLVFDFIKRSHKFGTDIPRYDVQIFHVSRDGSNMNSIFRIWRMAYFRNKDVWQDIEIYPLNDKSSLVIRTGTGGKHILGFGCSEIEQDQGGTSRRVFWAFCDALRSNSDKASGGAPQLVGLYNSFNGFTTGIVFEKRRWVYGHEIAYTDNLYATEWRDELFQRVDPMDLKPISGAQKHGRSAPKAQMPKPEFLNKLA